MGSDVAANTFFIPGLGEDRQLTERTYAAMQRQLELELGSRPHTRRIARLWTRRGSTDCVTEVGLPDPLRGGIVLAIFDMGQQRPFVVWRRPRCGTPPEEHEILGKHAYSVVEFDA